jgi:hypothetical protein
MLVMPIFLPIIPFIFFAVYAPLRYRGHCADEFAQFNPCLLSTFSVVSQIIFERGSTDSKQTSKGLFICLSQLN